jgi:hypothetical protein
MLRSILCFLGIHKYKILVKLYSSYYDRKIERRVCAHISLLYCDGCGKSKGVVSSPSDGVLWKLDGLDLIASDIRVRKALKESNLWEKVVGDTVILSEVEDV